MDEIFSSAAETPSGYRLHKLELFNWGTFDSTRGNVHSASPNGVTTLLIGENGSGKSTLVDALLTLLVRPVVRNYNVAAGAHKQERDERTYIKGAHGRAGRDEDNRAEIQYLRPGGQHYAVILACFRNGCGDTFTLAQLLYLTADGRPDKVYCFAPDERSVAEHCANLTGTERARQQMQKRGFRATRSYTEYFNWFVRVTGVRPKAMDMFNQTVAVKDIQSLNRFIREHMLEAKPWREKIESLQVHFMQLSEAHQSLVRIRRQFELLGPIVAKAGTFREHSEAMSQFKRRLEAADSYFRQRTVEVLEPECQARESELERLAMRKRDLDRELTLKQNEVRLLDNEIEAAGGDRLKQLPLLIRHEASQADSKLRVWQQLRDALAVVGLPTELADSKALDLIHKQLPGVLTQIQNRITTLEADRDTYVIERAQLNRQRADDQAELKALQQRQGNLPEWIAIVRRRLCEDLRLSEKDLPFVAELVAVIPDERAWQASIEMVLRGFALSLLVPQRHYSHVAAYINSTRLADARGHGQRLTYLRVGERIGSPSGAHAIHPQSLLRKVELRKGHPLTPWVQGELEHRFDVRCCDSVEEFQAAHGLSMTRERHIKWRGGERHEKDDRERASDPRNFVLGWDNREKRRLLTDEIRRLDVAIADHDKLLEQNNLQRNRLGAQATAIEHVKTITDFSTIDFATHERTKKQLEEEKRSLEDNNDAIRVLRRRRTEVEEAIARAVAARDDAIKAEGKAEEELKTGKQLIGNAEKILSQRRSDGALATHAQSFPDIDPLIPEPLTAENLATVEQRFIQSHREGVDRLHKEMEPLRNSLCSAMNHYLRQFPDEQADLDATVESLDSFCALHEHIVRDDLPRHEARFKERLNEKVIQEIGLLNGAFENERTEIVTKINLLNQSLQQLEYRPGTFMRLEPRPVRDREIAEFQDSLRQCLAGTFEGTLEADEARYLRIEKFLARLREEERWRDKVTDVRRWFDFVARELDAATGHERAYYEDSAGQSGGEKAKLAFTILVAAIAYQYNLDPSRPDQNRFCFVVVDEMFSKVDDKHAEYALALFEKFGLQLLIVAPLDAKARVTEPHVGCYLHVVKDSRTSFSEIFSMTAREFENVVFAPQELEDRGPGAEIRGPGVVS